MRQLSFICFFASSLLSACGSGEVMVPNADGITPGLEVIGEEIRLAAKSPNVPQPIDGESRLV